MMNRLHSHVNKNLVDMDLSGSRFVSTHPAQVLSHLLLAKLNTILKIN